MASTSTESAAVSPWSCFNCRRRKIRCDRLMPCTYCSKGGFECRFPSSGRMPTRQYDLKSAKTGKEKQADLLDRIRRLESLVEDLSTQLGGEAAHLHMTASREGKDHEHHQQASPPDTDATSDTIAPLTEEFGRLFSKEDGTMYIGNRFWAVLWDELSYVREALEIENGEEPSVDPTAHLYDQQLGVSLPFFWGLQSGGEQQLRPLPSQISFIWEVFVERVDPFIKVLHIPTTYEIIRASNCQIEVLSLGMQALILAVSLAAIRSLSDYEVLSSFGEERTTLLDRYTLGTEQALAQAGVLDTTDISVIQAFTIYLEAMNRKKGMRAVWSLTGLLIRAAESMGLHRDGSHFPELTPFQVEMRRRLWWHICFIDSKVGDCQVSEVSINESIFDTQEPANLNDADIHPTMTAMPASDVGFTDSTPCLVKCELWRLSRHIQSSMSILQSRRTGQAANVESILGELDSSGERIARDLLSESMSERPIYHFVKTFAYLYLAEDKLIIHHKDLFRDVTRARTSSPEQTQKFFLSALAGFQSTLALVTQPETKKWGWIFHDQVQWPAISIVLVQLSTRPWSPTCEHAWVVVQKMFSTFADISKTQLLRPPLHNLVAAVRCHRAEEIQRLNVLPGVTLHLGKLAKTHPLGDLTAQHEFVGGDAMFDTLAAEQRLATETAISSGIVQPSLGLELNNTEETSEVASNWEDMWRELSIIDNSMLLSGNHCLTGLFHASGEAS